MEPDTSDTAGIVPAGKAAYPAAWLRIQTGPLWKTHTAHGGKPRIGFWRRSMSLEQEIDTAARRMMRRYFDGHYKKTLVENLLSSGKTDDRQAAEFHAENSLRYSFAKRNFRHFQKAAGEFCRREGFQPEGFIDSVLAEEPLFPPQLASERVWKIYERNKGEFQQEKRKTSEIKELAERVKKVFVFLGKRTVRQAVSSTFVRNDLLEQYDNDVLDLCVYCFSSAFMELAEKERMYIDFPAEQGKIKRFPKIRDKIKEKLGDDFKEL